MLNANQGEANLSICSTLIGFTFKIVILYVLLLIIFSCENLCRIVAHGLKALGLDEGSAIAIDMPMHVNSVIIYLAIVLAGYAVVSIADSFAPNEISTRLNISGAKAIFTQVVLFQEMII